MSVCTRGSNSATWLLSWDGCRVPSSTTRRTKRRAPRQLQSFASPRALPLSSPVGCAAARMVTHGRGVREGCLPVRGRGKAHLVLVEPRVQLCGVKVVIHIPARASECESGIDMCINPVAREADRSLVARHGSVSRALAGEEQQRSQVASIAAFTRASQRPCRARSSPEATHEIVAVLEQDSLV